MCDADDNSGGSQLPILRGITMRPKAEDTLVLMDTGRPVGPATAPVVPAKLGRYKIDHELGHGAMGIVYRARDPMINREVALKAIPLASEFERRRTRRGAGAILSRGRDGRAAESPAHRDGLRRGRGPRHWPTSRWNCCAAAISSSTRASGGCCRCAGARAGCAARRRAALCAPAPGHPSRHQTRQYHVRRRIDELKITDFGIARLTDTGRTHTGIVLGTPSFMSPEQLEGRPLTGQLRPVLARRHPLSAAHRSAAVPRRLDAAR